MTDARDDMCSEIAVHIAMWTPWGNVPELAGRPGIVVKVPTGGGPKRILLRGAAAEITRQGRPDGVQRLFPEEQ
jgi:hypothetical protein